jgi:hypothetical protein
MKYYVLMIWQDVEPSLSEPFDNEEDRDKKAIQLRQEDDDNESGFYRLDIDDNGMNNCIPSVESYGYQELHPDETVKEFEDFMDDDVADGNYREDAFKTD